jgi:hypothetical protein
VLENGKPAVEFDGTNDVFSISTITAATNFGVYFVSKSLTTSGNRKFFIDESQNSFNLFLNNTEFNWYDGATVHVLKTADTEQNLYAINKGTSTSEAYINGVNLSISTIADADLTTLSFGGRTGIAQYSNARTQEFILYASDKSTDRTSIEGNISAYYQSAKLLDEQFGSGAEAAYSTRQLRRAQTECMVIRRASDSTTQTIGFDASGNIDEAAINTFCSGTTCTVYQWIDQSGNGNTATAAAQANEPTIYTGGALVKDGGRLALDFDGLANNFTSTINNVSQGFDIYTVHNFNTTPTATQRLYDSDNGGRITRGSNSTANNFAFAGTVLSWSPQQTGQVQETTVYNGVSSLVRVSGTQAASGDAGTNSTGTDLVLGADQSATTHYIEGQIQEIILFDNSKSTTDRTSIEENIGDYFTQNTPLLDTYSGAAAAYSLRKLSSSYSGALIRVRRSSDNTELDINANVFGELDTVSLLAFAGAGDAFVKTWYDQSGNSNDATQTTTASQPQIVSSGAVIVENGKPTVQFDGANDVMSVDFQGNTNSAMMACLVLRQDSTSSLNGALGGDGSNIMDLFTDYGGTIYYDNGNRASNRLGVATPATWEDNQHLAAFYATTTNQFINVDGTQIATKSGLTSVTASYKLLGATSVGNAFFGGAIQEVIVYPSDQSSNRTNIESNINTFYSIY